ncbi:MAG: hypothetical protein AAB652_00710 [Patescibacteria group bacterium]
MANIDLKKGSVLLPKSEYLRLKKLDERFRGFFAYIEHLMDIREARSEVKQKKLIPQATLFKRLGI